MTKEYRAELPAAPTSDSRPEQGDPRLLLGHPLFARRSRVGRVPPLPTTLHTASCGPRVIIIDTKLTGNALLVFFVSSLQ